MSSSGSPTQQPLNLLMPSQGSNSHLSQRSGSGSGATGNGSFQILTPLSGSGGGSGANQQGGNSPTGLSSQPAPSGTGASDPNRSTRPCRHFQRGRCTWGDQCRFAHRHDPALAAAENAAAAAERTLAMGNPTQMSVEPAAVTLTVAGLQQAQLQLQRHAILRSALCGLYSMTKVSQNPPTLRVTVQNPPIDDIVVEFLNPARVTEELRRLDADQRVQEGGLHYLIGEPSVFWNMVQHYHDNKTTGTQKWDAFLHAAKNGHVECMFHRSRAGCLCGSSCPFPHRNMVNAATSVGGSFMNSSAFSNNAADSLSGLGSFGNGNAAGNNGKNTSSPSLNGFTVSTGESAHPPRFTLSSTGTPTSMGPQPGPTGNLGGFALPQSMPSSGELSSLGENTPSGTTGSNESGWSPKKFSQNPMLPSANSFTASQDNVDEAAGTWSVLTSSNKAAPVAAAPGSSGTSNNNAPPPHNASSNSLASSIW